MTSLLIFMLGASLASFLTAWADRYPASILYPPSHCSTCQQALAWWDLVPILSYIKLGGSCRSCQAPIPLASLTNEIQGGLIAYAWLQSWLPSPWLIFLFMSLMLSHFDRTSCSFPICFWLVPHAALTLTTGWQLSPVFLLLALVCYFTPIGIGAGDWTYMASLALLLPLKALLIILQLACYQALLTFWYKKRKGALPFLPFLHRASLLWLIGHHFSFF